MVTSRRATVAARPQQEFTAVQTRSFAGGRDWRTRRLQEQTTYAIVGATFVHATPPVGATAWRDLLAPEAQKAPSVIFER